MTWWDGKHQAPLIAVAYEHEAVLIAEFDLDDIPRLRLSESSRLGYRYRATHADNQ